MNTKIDSTGAQANWFVGASYGGTDDQMPRFLAEGIWENGYDDKLLDIGYCRHTCKNRTWCVKFPCHNLPRYIGNDVSSGSGTASASMM